jgi:peptidoglycan DL-endopeptidase CwlO
MGPIHASGQPQGQGRSIRTAFLRLCLVTGAALVILAPGGAAQAAPSAADIEAQITTAWNNLEPVIEAYNKVHGDLQANQAKADALEQTLKPLELQIDLAMSQVSGIAAESYKHGAASRVISMINSGDQTNLLDQISIINQMSRQQLAEISSVKATRDKYLADKAALSALLSQLTAQNADLAAKKTSIQSQIDSLQKLRLAAYGTTGSVGGSLKPPGVCPVDYISGPGNAAAVIACAQIGKPYVYATAGPRTFDCSGLTQYAWAGKVSLTHNAADQYAKITHISAASLRTGDLVFYGSPIHHVGIYVGSGWMVHAPHTGDVVRMAKISEVGTPSGYGRPA